MSKNLIFQLDIKGFDWSSSDFWRPYPRYDKLYSDSKKTAIDYARRVNADYVCLSQGLLDKKYAPNHQKLSFYHYFEYFNYDKILLLDCDTIVYDICPNIFDFDTVSAVSNNPTTDSPYWPVMRDKWHFPTDSHPKVLNQLENHEIPFDYDLYFCTGVMLVTRDFYEFTKDHWKSELEYRNTRNNVGYHDQTVINCLAYKHYPHERINMLSEDWGAWWKDSKYINHITGERKENYEEANISS